MSTTSAAPPASAWSAPPHAPVAGGIPQLVDVRAVHRPGTDRVVFEFTGGLPTTRIVRYVPELIADPSGLPLPIAGRAILSVVMSPANAHDEAGEVTAPLSVAVALPNVMTVLRSGDFEAVTSYGIGLAKREPFRVSALGNPDRIVLDIGAAFPTVQKKVWFFNEPRFLANTEPFFTAVLRPVRPGSAPTGMLDRIFAGPTNREYDRGLRLLRSEATGFSKLRIGSAGVARVQLTEGCSSGGATVTIAGEIMPTLRQLATVDFVKIYDPAGTTENPTGRSDSIPECLEP